MASLLRWTAVALCTGHAIGDFFVSPAGSDSNNGSALSPFKSLTKARMAVRTCNSNLTEDLRVTIRAGTYYLDQPLNFTAADSGSNGYRVIWQGDENAGAVNISGGQVSSCNPLRHANTSQNCHHELDCS
jgi:hypothetical protein